MARAKVKVMRDVLGELHAGGKVRQVRLNLIVNDRGVMRAEPAELVNAPDGPYELRYVFDGRQETKSVRVDRGDILGQSMDEDGRPSSR